MRRIRVMIVDDVAIVRRLVADALAVDPELQVVGMAANGREALAKIPSLAPDLIVLDYEMPEMDGLETLRELKRSWPASASCSSAPTPARRQATLDALWLGADDYATKVSASDLVAASRCVQTELIPKIRALCGPDAEELVEESSRRTPAGGAPRRGAPAHGGRPDGRARRKPERGSDGDRRDRCLDGRAAPSRRSSPTCRATSPPRS